MTYGNAKKDVCTESQNVKKYEIKLCTNRETVALFGVHLFNVM